MLVALACARAAGSAETSGQPSLALPSLISFKISFSIFARLNLAALAGRVEEGVGVDGVVVGVLVGVVAPGVVVEPGVAAAACAATLAVAAVVENKPQALAWSTSLLLTSARDSPIDAAGRGCTGSMPLAFLYTDSNCAFTLAYSFTPSSEAA